MHTYNLYKENEVIAYHNFKMAPYDLKHIYVFLNIKTLELTGNHLRC